MKDKFDQFLEETGLAAKAEARGVAKGKVIGEAKGFKKGRDHGRTEERGVWQNVVANKDAEIARLRELLKNKGLPA